jgi:hypothetical protein
VARVMPRLVDGWVFYKGQLSARSLPRWGGGLSEVAEVWEMVSMKFDAFLGIKKVVCSQWWE